MDSEKYKNNYLRGTVRTKKHWEGHWVVLEFRGLAFQSQLSHLQWQSLGQLAKIPQGHLVHLQNGITRLWFLAHVKMHRKV